MHGAMQDLGLICYFSYAIVIKQLLQCASVTYLIFLLSVCTPALFPALTSGIFWMPINSNLAFLVVWQ